MTRLVGDKMSMAPFVSTIFACTLSILSNIVLTTYIPYYRWANATLGSQCVIENTPYIAYGFQGEFINIVSR